MRFTMPAVGQRHRILAGGASRVALRSQLSDARVRLNSLGEQLLDDARFVINSASSLVELSCVTVNELGFANGAKFEEILGRASSLDLEVCSLEVAVRFRLQYGNQPEGALGQPPTVGRAPPGSITVMSSAPVHEDQPWGFYLRCIEGELWLRGYRSWHGHVWSPEDMLAFTVTTSAA